MNIIFVAVICLLVATLSKLLQTSSHEIAFAITCLCALMVFGIVADKLSDVFSSLYSFIERAGVSSGYLDAAVKVLGISYICELCSSSCRDAGESSLGMAIDISGKIAISLICMPMISALMEVITKILER